MPTERFDPETVLNSPEKAELTDAVRLAHVAADLRHAAEDAEAGVLSAEDLAWLFSLVETRFVISRAGVTGPRPLVRLTPELHAAAKAVAAVCIARQHGGRFERGGYAWTGTIDGTLRAAMR